MTIQEQIERQQEQGFEEYTAPPVSGRAAVKVAQAAQNAAVAQEQPEQAESIATTFLKRVEQWILRCRAVLGKTPEQGGKAAVAFSGPDGKAFLFESREEAMGLIRAARGQVNKLDTFKLEFHQLPGTGTDDKPARWYVTGTAKARKSKARTIADYGFLARWGSNRA